MKGRLAFAGFILIGLALGAVSLDLRAANAADPPTTAAGDAGAACAACADGDAAALQLADQVGETAAPARDWRAFFEGAIGTSEGRRTAASAGTQRVSAALAIDHRLAPGWRLVFDDRLDLGWTGLGDRGTLNTLKDAYISWQPTGAQALDMGRIKTRYGTAYGYNPTDFFRAGAVRSIVSNDPNSLRDNRLGTGMIRGQTVWTGGSLTAMLAPKLGSSPSSAPFSLDLGATNAQTRWLLVASQRLSARIDPQWLLFGGPGQSPQLGLNLSGLLDDATVLFVEASTGRSPSLLHQALGASGPAGSMQVGAQPGATALGRSDDTRWRQRVSAGTSITLPAKTTLTFEYEYNGAAPSAGDWRALFATPSDYVAYRGLVRDQLELPTRQALFSYLAVQDIGVQHLDLNAFMRYDIVDHSRTLWAELRYHFDRAELALQGQVTGGGVGSDFGEYPQRRTLLALVRYFL